MRGIREERLKVLKKQYKCSFNDAIFDYLLKECQELNPWLSLEEFLKSGFVGKCWVLAANDTVHEARYSNNEFNDVASPIYYYDHGNIKGVMPIHKPEPPR